MDKQMESRQKQRFLRLPQVLEIFPVSKSTWWQGIREGKYPKPVKLSVRTSAWRESDIDDLIDRLGNEPPASAAAADHVHTEQKDAAPPIGLPRERPSIGIGNLRAP